MICDFDLTENQPPLDFLKRMHGDACESERNLSAFVIVSRNVRQLHLLSSLKC